VGFYPRDAMLAWVYATAFPSVCVSVCLSVCLPVCHTRALYQKGYTFRQIFFRLVAPSFLFFVTKGRCLTPTTSPLMGAPNTRGGEKIWRFLNIRSVYLGNGARYGRSCYKSRIGNHTELPNGATSDDLE